MKRRSMLGRRSSRLLASQNSIQAAEKKSDTQDAENTPMNAGRMNPFQSPFNYSPFPLLSKTSTTNSKPGPPQFHLQAPKSVEKPRTSRASLKPGPPQFLFQAPKSVEMSRVGLTGAKKQDEEALSSHTNFNLSTNPTPTIVVSTAEQTFKSEKAWKNNEGTSARTLYVETSEETISNQPPGYPPALRDVSFGVSSLDLLDEHCIQEKVETMFDKTNLTAYKSLLGRVVEEESFEVDSSANNYKENVPPRDDLRTPEPSSPSSVTSDQTPLNVPRRSTSGKNETRLTQLGRIIQNLSSRIKTIDEEKRDLELERQRAFDEAVELLINGNSAISLPSEKRRILGSSSAKRRPSYVASKLIKNKGRPTKSDISSILESPSTNPQMGKLYTPKSLSVRLNKQYSFIFDQ